MIFISPIVTLLMDLYEIRVERLGTIAEESEHQDLSRESTSMESYGFTSDRGGRTPRGVSTFQRFSVDTNESLSFEPCEDIPPSPTGAEDGDDEDDVFKDGGPEVGMHPLSDFTSRLRLKDLLK